MSLPNFLIVGVARSGTTTLYDYLRTSPHVFLPKKKEPKFFMADIRRRPYGGPGDMKANTGAINTESDFRRLFASAKGISSIGEASPNSLYYHEIAIPKILDLLGEPKIFIILRNPVERAYSAWKHLAIRARETRSFEYALANEDERVKNNYASIWHLKRVGLYYEPVKHYLESFRTVHVYIYEDWKHDFGALANELLKEMGEPPMLWPERIVSNKGGVPKNLTLQRYLKGGKWDTIVKFRNKVLPFIPAIGTTSWLSKKNITQPTMKMETRKKLWEYFSKDIERLSELLGRDLVCLWQTEVKRNKVEK